MGTGQFTAYGNLFGGSITPVALVNTLLASGGPTNCGGSILSLGHNLSSDGTCPLTATGDLSGTNPLLGPFQDNGGPSFSLMPTAPSPVVNAGENGDCPATDQRGVSRPIGAFCDIGAIETPYKTPQTINFGQLPALLSLRTPPFTVSANATSGRVVSFSSLTPSICTVGGAPVTLVASGTCTVRTTQAGDATYAAAPNVDRNFEVLGHILFIPVAMRESASLGRETNQPTGNMAPRHNRPSRAWAWRPVGPPSHRAPWQSDAWRGPGARRR